MMASRSVPAAQPLLVVRVTAAGKDARIAWVASMQCRMTGSDEGRLAQELGRVIGGALGTRVERQASAGLSKIPGVKSRSQKSGLR